jgi:hypothetical protein
MKAKLKFFSTSEHFDAEKPYELFLDAVPRGIPATNCEFCTEQVDLQDIREMPVRPTLDKEGYEVLDSESAILRDAKQLDDPDIADAYLGETIRLIQTSCRASKVICYDWRVRFTLALSGIY